LASTPPAKRLFLPATGRSVLLERATIVCALLAMAPPVAARPGLDSPFGRDSFPHASHIEAVRRDGQTPIREIEVATFIAETALATTLGQGSIEMLGSPDGRDESGIFEAAVIEQLITAGYETAMPPGKSRQVTELRVVRRELPFEERPHKPVSGEVSVGVGNRGSSAGWALSVDLSKPPGPLIVTRFEARIRDRASNELLWEGRAEVVTREDDRRWTDEYTAGRLAEALFENFPDRL
jgi:hypothetical protein